MVNRKSQKGAATRDRAAPTPKPDPNADSTVNFDRLFLALGDRTRRAMLDRLTHRPHSVSALAEPLGITLTAVAQHLQLLEECGLVRTEKQDVSAPAALSRRVSTPLNVGSRITAQFGTSASTASANSLRIQRTTSQVLLGPVLQFKRKKGGFIQSENPPFPIQNINISLRRSQAETASSRSAGSSMFRLKLSSDSTTSAAP